MDTLDQLATALASAQAEMKNAPLNKINPHFKNKYADLAAIRDATLPALNKHGLSIWQGTEMSADGFFLITRLIHKSGQSLASVYPLPLATDKPQMIGSALTYARRYAWAAACGITADDDDDAETASKAKTNGNGTHPETKGAGPISAEQYKTLTTALNEVGAQEHQLATYFQIPDLKQLPAAKFQRAMQAVEGRRTAQR
jgi:hypothetical protein